MKSFKVDLLFVLSIAVIVGVILTVNMGETKDHPKQAVNANYTSVSYSGTVGVK